MTTSTTPTDAFTTEWQEWHHAHEARLASPHGFLAITSLRWLGEVPTRFPDAPGTWSTDREDATVVLA
jgi:uncharacterized protein